MRADRRKLLAGLPAALAPGGRALLVLSTDGDTGGMLAALDGQSLAHRAVAHRDLGNEVLTVHAVTQPA